MPGKKVVFKRLLLRGFGLYREKIEAFFEPGLNNFITPNERGKSTLVAGIIAILYGLPHRNNPAEFTLACYRNWENPRRCQGELEFTVNEEHYFLQRDFDTNHISFWKWGAEEKRLLAEGIHNPASQRKPHPEYERILQEVFGLPSRSLFESIFCILQPFPEMRKLSHEVQKLLSGGGLDFQRPLVSLEEELKDLTRFTRDLGITPRNSTRDKKLESLQGEIELLRRRLQEEKEAVDSLEELQGELLAVEGKIKRIRQEQQHRRRILEAWSEWKRRRDNYESAFREYRAIAEACQEAEKIHGEMETKGALLQRDYPEFQGWTEKEAQKLEELFLLEEKRREAQKALEEIERALQEKGAGVQKVEAELGAFPGWEKLGGDPLARVREIRKNAAALFKEWSDFQNELEELAQKELLLETEYALFQQAAPPELEAVKSCSRRAAELKETREKAFFYLERAREKQKDYEKARQAFREKFRELENAPGEELLRQKLEALENEKDCCETVERLQKKLAPAWGTRLVFAIFLAFLAAAAAGAFERALLVPGFFLGALAGYFLAPLCSGLLKRAVKKELRETEAKLFSCRAELSHLNGELGPFAEASPARLGSLLEKFRQYKEEKADLEAKEREVPSAEVLAALEKELRQAEEDYRAFLELTAKFSASFAEPEEAYGKWLQIRQERDDLAAKTKSYARKIFGCEPRDVLKTDLCRVENGPWEEVAGYLQILFPEKELTAVTDLLALLQECSDHTWSQMDRRAQEYEALIKSKERLAAALEALEKRRQEEEGRFVGIKEKMEEYCRQLTLVLARAGGDIRRARERWSARQGLLHELEIKKSQLQTILGQFQAEGLEELREKKLEREVFLKQRLEQWQELLEKFPGLPSVEESREPEKIALRLQSLEEEAKELEQQLEALQGEEEQLKTRLLLLKGRESLNIARAELELAALEEQKKELELLRDALVTAHRELTAAIFAYQEAYQRHLQEAATEYYQKITKNPRRKIILDQEFQVRVEEGGRPVEIAQLSKGAQDQLYLALRLAIGDLMAENIKLPFIFDDPFVSSDQERLENICAILNATAGERQYALFSHNSFFSSWGTPVKILSNKDEEESR